MARSTKGLKKDPAAAQKAVADAQWRAYTRARDNGHLDWLEDGQKFDRFYLGDQWDANDVTTLDSEGRPHLTINLTMKVVNAFLGEHEKQRADIRFLPARDGSNEVATILSKLSEQVLEENNYTEVEAQLFQDGLVVDRGFLDVRLDFDKNVAGTVKIVADDPFEIIPDPDAKTADPSEWNEVMKSAWMTLTDIEAHYGKDARVKVESLISLDPEFGYGHDSIRYDGSRTFGSDFIPDTSSQHVMDDESTVRSVRVLERQYKQLALNKYFVDPVTGEMSLVPHDLDELSIRRIVNNTGVGIIEKVGYRIKWVVTAGSCVLHDKWSPYRTFTVIPFFPYFRRGKASGVVRQLVSPQEQHNKYESQMLHVVNTSANSGWMFQTGSLVNMTADELENRGAETGLVIEVARGADAPQKIQPNQIPSGLDRIAERTRAAIAEITGIAPEVGDSQTREMDGVLIDSVQTRNMAQVQVPFRGLAFTRKLLGRKILELVQDFYTETRVLRITNWDDLDAAQEEVVINLMDSAGSIVNDISLGVYDVVVSTAPARDGFQKAQFAEALLMRERGIVIPDEHVIRLSNLENRHLIADQVATLQGTAPPTEQEMQMSQMQMQLQFADAEARLQDLQAEVQLKQAQAMLAMAKAKTEEGAEQLRGAEMAVELNKELAGLQTKLKIAREEFQNKLAIAELHSSAKRNGEMLSHASKSLGNQLNFRAQMEKIAVDRIKTVSPTSSQS